MPRPNATEMKRLQILCAPAAISRAKTSEETKIITRALGDAGQKAQEREKAPSSPTARQISATRQRACGQRP